MIRIMHILKGDKFMETVDFRTFKQKMHDVKSKAIVGWDNTKYRVGTFCKENKEFCLGLALAAIPGAIQFGNSIVRHHMVVAEDKRRQCDIWDPKKGIHYVVRKPLSHNQQIEYNMRYANGEDGASILRSMRLY